MDGRVVRRVGVLGGPPPSPSAPCPSWLEVKVSVVWLPRRRVTSVSAVTSVLSLVTVDHHVGGGLGVQLHGVGCELPPSGMRTVSAVSDTVTPASSSVTVTASSAMLTASYSLALLGGHHRVGDGGHAVHGVGVLGGSAPSPSAPCPSWLEVKVSVVWLPDVAASVYVVTVGFVAGYR